MNIGIFKVVNTCSGITVDVSIIDDHIKLFVFDDISYVEFTDLIENCDDVRKNR